jgi:hypothetical protein
MTTPSAPGTTTAATVSGAPPETSQAVLAANFRSSQAFVAAALTLDVVQAWQSMEPYSIRASWPAVEIMIASAVRTQYRTAALNGSQFYAEMRSIAGVAGVPPSVMPGEIPTELITRVLGARGPGTVLHDVKVLGNGPIQLDRAMQHAAVNLSGAATKMVLSGARQAVMQKTDADVKAIGWVRVTSGSCCAFCAMLASRGAVYKSEGSADFEAHDHCSCAAAPFFTGQSEDSLLNPDIRALWDSSTKKLSGNDAINAFRRAWSAQQNDDSS